MKTTFGPYDRTERPDDTTLLGGGDGASRGAADAALLSLAGPSGRQSSGTGGLAALMGPTLGSLGPEPALTPPPASDFGVPTERRAFATALAGRPAAPAGIAPASPAEAFAPAIGGLNPAAAPPGDLGPRTNGLAKMFRYKGAA